MPRVSIVIPAFNAASLLGATLKSVFDSTYHDYEVVVVDDGSKDETATVACSFGSRVRVIRQANAGMSPSRNRAINAGDSEFVALLDSDDLWHPAKLRLQIAALDVNPDHAFCYTGFEVWHGSDPTEFMARTLSGAIDPAFSGWVYHKLILTNWALPSSLMFRRKAWEQGGSFLCNDQQTDDWEYIVRSSQMFRFLRLAEPFVLYRQHPSSLSRRLPALNSGELMRESLIKRFGSSSPDGQKVDSSELAAWRYTGWSTFADAHCARGNLRTGLSTFAQLLMNGPNRMESLSRLAKSLVRRAVPKR